MTEKEIQVQYNQRNKILEQKKEYADYISGKAGNAIMDFILMGIAVIIGIIMIFVAGKSQDLRQATMELMSNFAGIIFGKLQGATTQEDALKIGIRVVNDHEGLWVNLGIIYITLAIGNGLWMLAATTKVFGKSNVRVTTYDNYEVSQDGSKKHVGASNDATESCFAWIIVGIFKIWFGFMFGAGLAFFFIPFRIVRNIIRIFKSKQAGSDYLAYEAEVKNWLQSIKVE